MRGIFSGMVMQRNENDVCEIYIKEKVKKAAEEYAETSEKSFKTITNILDRRYDIINPVFSDFIKSKTKNITV